jgi:beta-glucosidase
MQGDDPKYLKTIVAAKHFAVHSGPEPSRHTFDAVVDERDLRETYLPHFEAAIREGGAYSVVCAYNSVDGQPACANTRLLSDILRKEWGFQGYVVSDCGAIGDIYLNHRFSSNANEGVAKAIKAGTDLNWGVEYGSLLSAVRAGLLKESEIDQSLRRLLVARFKLGMFDPPAMVKYAQIPYSENDSPAHRQLAVETARKSIVLLKNQNRLPPLSKATRTIAVIGPNADDAKTQLGNYNGIPAAPPQWPQRRIFQQREFRWQGPPPGRAYLSELRQDSGRDSAQTEAALHARRSQHRFPLGRWSTPCRHERRRFRCALDGLPLRARHRHPATGRHWHERLRALS